MKSGQFFIKSAGAILLFAGLERLFLAPGSSAVLAFDDPFVGIPIRYSLLIVGAVELAGAFFCLFGKTVHLQLGFTVWLGVNFFIFRIGSVWMNIHSQATGIGSLNDPLLLSRGFVGHLTALVPFYIVLGSLATAGWMWLFEARLPGSHSRNFPKMSCPSCGGHIRFAIQDLGKKIPCPHCKTAIALRKPENVKMSCFFCKEHIEFPTHALGEKLKCPHCSKNITLKEATVI